MKILLTGITGNLGYELAFDLFRRGVDVVPVVRPNREVECFAGAGDFSSVVENDLLSDAEIESKERVDIIVHSAGVVRFDVLDDANTVMMKKIITFAKRHEVKHVNYISTAFVYRPDGDDTHLNNKYEIDKYNSEQLLVTSGLSYTIFRPSVLVGSTVNGEIRNFSGYYHLVQAYISAIKIYSDNNIGARIFRSPKMPGESNMIPIDQASECICNAVLSDKTGVQFVVNPKPPTSSWVFDKTLSFYNLRDKVDVVDLSFEEFGRLDLVVEERKLYDFISHFNPYWSLEYKFPESICNENLITDKYIVRALNYFEANKEYGYKKDKL